MAVGKLLKSHPIATMIVMVVLTLVVPRFIPVRGSLGVTLAYELVCAVLVAVVVLLVGGRAVAKPQARGMGQALLAAAYPLAFAFLIGGLSGIAYMILAGGPSADWPLLLLYAVVLCLLVGVFEEWLFRGIVLNALLAKMGATRAGVVGAAVATSVAFGVLHVAPYAFSGEIADASTAAQALFKATQAGIVGLLFAAIFLRTRNLWAVTLVHAANDLFVMVPYTLFTNAAIPQYVTSDPATAAMMVPAYVIALVFYVPVLVIAVLLLRKVDVPFRGFFAEDMAAKPDPETEPGLPPYAPV